MAMWHPASLLIFWIGFAFLLQWLPLSWLLPVTAACLVIATLLAPQRSRRLLWRSRWLLFSLMILFMFFTPGEYVAGHAGDLGVTHDGLRRAAEQLSLIVAMLSSLAWLHERVGTPGLLAGLYWLLGWHGGRGKTIVRLMLVLEFAEKRQATSWRDWLAAAQDRPEAEAVLQFAYAPPRWRDHCGIALVLLAMLAWLAMQ